MSAGGRCCWHASQSSCQSSALIYRRNGLGARSAWAVRCLPARSVRLHARCYIGSTVALRAMPQPYQHRLSAFLPSPSMSVRCRKAQLIVIVGTSTYGSASAEFAGRSAGGDRNAADPSKRRRRPGVEWLCRTIITRVPANGRGSNRPVSRSGGPFESRCSNRAGDGCGGPVPGEYRR